MVSSNAQRFVALVGIDFSDLSTRALDAALEFAGLHDGEVHVVYVHQDLPLEAVMGDKAGETATANATLEQVRHHAEERVRALPVRPGMTLRRVVAHFRRGAAAEQIAQLATDLDADLVVVGSHGRHGISRVVLGSVAERVSHLARCPVWIIRPKMHANGERVPEIEPPCPDCVVRREATGGQELWCKRHAEPSHLRLHTYAYVSDGMYSGGSSQYTSTPTA